MDNLTKYQRFYRRHREKKLKEHKEWRQKNRKKVRTYNKKRDIEVKIEVFSHYCKGKPYCQCPNGCSEGHLEFLTIDHIDGGGNKHRKKLNHGGGRRFYRWLKRNEYPKEYRVLCMNCNMAFGRFGYCPHGRTSLYIGGNQ